MEIAAVALAALGLASVPSAVGAWLFQTRRARRRNEEGRCAWCTRSWSDLGDEDRFLLHGRLVCEECAERTRRRLPRQFALITTMAVSAGLVAALKEGLLFGVLVAPVSVALMGGAFVAVMKLQNQRAQLEIARGDYAGLLASDSAAE